MFHLLLSTYIAYVFYNKLIIVIIVLWLELIFFFVTCSYLLYNKRNEENLHLAHTLTSIKKHIDTCIQLLLETKKKLHSRLAF